MYYGKLIEKFSFNQDIAQFDWKEVISHFSSIIETGSYHM